MQKNQISTFLYNIHIFKHFYKNKNIPLEYIIFSPYIFNIIEGCKTSKDAMKKLFLLQMDISEQEYTDCLSFSSQKHIPDIETYLHIHSYITEYHSNYTLWLNKMYFSTINMMYTHNSWNTHSIFKKYPLSINTNALDLRNIVIPLNLMLQEALVIITHNDISLEYIQKNNLLLMLLSDFKDIKFNIREKEYFFPMEQIDSFIDRLVMRFNISEEELWDLPYKNLMKTNHERYNMR